MAEGEFGEPVRWAMQFHLSVASFFGASRFVEVSTAHMMGDTEVLGAAGIEHLERLVEAGATVRVPTTTNARCVDLHEPHVLGQRESLIESEQGVAASLRAMGITLTDTCINYQSVYQPSFGEHLAWGDTGTVIYANSIVGARSNFESGPSALSAALTGRVPAYGFHLSDSRRPTMIVDLQAELADVADWGAVGGIVGEAAKEYWQVPLIRSEARPRGDELKHLGASLASYGSLAMFHFRDVTPEAGEYPDRELEAITHHVTIDDDDLRRFYNRFAATGTVDVVVLSGPQLSLLELKATADALDGRRVADGTELIITTNLQNLSAAANLGYVEKLTAAGAKLVVGTCFYLMGLNELRDRNGWRTVVTNSAKVANIVGGYRLESVLKRTAACLESAVTGKV